MTKADRERKIVEHILSKGLTLCPPDQGLALQDWYAEESLNDRHRASAEVQMHSDLRAEK